MMATATLQQEAETTLAQLTGQYAAHPARFFTEVLQTDTLPKCASPLVEGGLWEGQRRILEALNPAIQQHKPIYIGSGHALGKDFISGGIPLWWQTTRYPAKTILTGPKAQQVHEITWNELVAHAGRWRSELGALDGRLMHGKYEWDEQHFILAMTTSHSEQHIGKMQGYHSPHILIIVTEAQAVPNSIKQQLDGLTTSGEVLFIAIGNPLMTTGWFADGLRNRRDNIVINLDCEQSPNVIEGREVIPGLVSKAWVEEKRRVWYAENPQHPLWLSKVKGQIPTTSVDSVFDRELIEKSWNYHLIDRGTRVSMGVDPAEFGDDESAFAVISDGIPKRMLTTAKHEPTDTAGRANALRVSDGVQVVVVDRLGVGAGVASMLLEMREPGWQVLPFAGSEKPLQVDISPYANQRAESYFYAREQLQLGKVKAPSDGQTVDELCETRYYYNSKGKMLLERKEDVKERLGRSPDRADAWVMAVWGLQFLPEQVEGGSVPHRLQRLVSQRQMARMQRQEAVAF